MTHVTVEIEFMWLYKPVYFLRVESDKTISLYRISQLYFMNIIEVSLVTYSIVNSFKSDLYWL